MFPALIIAQSSILLYAITLCFGFIFFMSFIFNSIKFTSVLITLSKYLKVTECKHNLLLSETFKYFKVYSIYMTKEKKQKEKESKVDLILENLNFVISEHEDKIKHQKRILDGLKRLKKYHKKIVLEEKK